MNNSQVSQEQKASIIGMLDKFDKLAKDVNNNHKQVNDHDGKYIEELNNMIEFFKNTESLTQIVGTGYLPKINRIRTFFEDQVKAYNSTKSI